MFNRNVKFGFLFVHITAITSLILTCIMLFWMVNWSDRGLDLTDDSYGYMWLKDPYQYEFAVRFHGFLLHPVNSLFGPSLVNMRIFGISISLIISFIFFHFFVFYMRFHGTYSHLSGIAILASCVAAIMFDRIWWLLNPNYNQIASWAYALFGIALAWCDLMNHNEFRPRSKQISTVFIAFCLALSGYLAFVARPPTAIAMFIIALVYYIIFHRKELTRNNFHTLLILYAFAFTLLLFVASAFFIINPLTYWEMISTGIALASNRSEASSLSNNLSALLELNLSSKLAIAAFLLTLIYYIARFKKFSIFLLSINFFLFISSIYTISPILYFDGSYNQLNFGSQIFILAITAIAVLLSLGMMKSIKISTNTLAILVVLLLGPFSVGIATAGNILNALSTSASLFIFMVLFASIIVLNNIGRIIVSFAVTLLSTAVFVVAINNPYHIWTPISEQTETVEVVGIASEKLSVDPETAKFITELRSASVTAGMPEGVELLDLTGKLPGIHLILNSRAPVYPWLAADYPVSPVILDLIWNKLSVIEKQRLWVAGPLDDSFAGASALSDLLPLNQNFKLQFQTKDPYTGSLFQLWKPNVKREANRGSTYGNR